MRAICASVRQKTDMWIELQSAAEVARLGTLSEAARSLRIHRATVARHVDALEAQLGAKLFIRHARGYSPTEFGEELLRIASTTKEQVRQLETRARGVSESLSGEFVLTSIDALTPQIMPAIRRFTEKYPSVRTRFIASQSLLKLEYGEAHVAIRLGPKPDDLDNVVKPFGELAIGLYASQSYVSEIGLPRLTDEFAKHRFVSLEGHAGRAPFMPWLRETISADNIVFSTSNTQIMGEAVREGLGIGFIPKIEAEKNPKLVEILAPRPEWSAPIWICTHVDLHRSAKVQAFLDVLTNRDLPNLE